MKATICIFIFCLVMVFLSCTSCLPTVVEPKHPPNAISATENDRLVFESIIAVHNTYFIVLIATLSVYFGIVGVCWKVVFGTDHKTPVPTLVRVLFLGIPVLVGVAVFIAMLYALDICAKHQYCLNNLSAKLDICSQDYLNGLVDNCSIDLSLLRNSVIVSMFVIGILSLASFFLCWKGDRHKQAGKIGTAGLLKKPA